MLSASFGVLSQNTGFYPSLDRIIETTLGPLNLGPGGGSYNEPISRLQRLKLKLGEQGGSQTQPPKMRMAMYCIMCGQSGHGICECSKSKFFIAQGICRMDVNNRVVMGDGSALLHADGEGGAAKQIHNLLSGNIPLTSNLTSASNIEVVAAEANYYDEPNELAVLGSMEFEVLPADRAEQARKNKPYEQPEAKKGDERGVPEVLTCPKGPQPN